MTAAAEGPAPPGARGGQYLPRDVLPGERLPDEQAPWSTSRPRPSGPRRVRLTVSRVDPWSVLKLSLVFGAALLVVALVAVGALYAVLDAAGVFSAVQQTVHSALNVHLPLSATAILGATAVIGLVNVVFLSALATVGAFVYNVAADLVGGLDVTLTER